MNQYVFREENFEELYRNYEKIEIKKCIICHSDKFTKWTKESHFQAYKCNDCALIFMNPQLSEEGLNKYYSDYIGRRRINNKLKMEQRNLQYKLDYNLINKFIAKGKILDVGCNGGFFLNFFDNDFEKHGTEVDQHAVEFAKKNFPELSKNIIFKKFENSEYDNNFFDLIIMRGVVEHVSNPELYIKEVSKKLKKNGLFYICATPNGSSFCANYFRERWSLFHPIQHLWHYSSHNLEILCSKYSLKLIFQDFPYIGTPYENVLSDINQINEQIGGISKKISPPFFENMMSLIFQKI